VTFGGIFKGRLDLLERPGREPIDLAGRDTARLRLQAPKKPPKAGLRPSTRVGGPWLPVEAPQAEKAS
jgi:hypothetical protein